MTFQIILFYIFAAIILFSAIKVVTSNNPVHAALWLVLTFCTSACMWILMQAEFLGIILVLVYVGAVMVLFLFVVMMLNIDIEEMRKGFWRNLPISMTVGILMAAVLILVLINPQTNLADFGVMREIAADYNAVRVLGEELYTVYLLPFELAAVLLVLGMVAAIALVHRPNTNPRSINPAEQIKARSQERMRMVKMAAFVEPETENQEDAGDETAKGEKA